MYSAEELSAMMATYSISPEAQASQTRFRCELVKSWDIQPGARLLEIGCGQGDTTLALANAVGVSGFVTATDLGHPDYGAPITIAASTSHLLNAPLGGRMEFHLGSDVLLSDLGFKTFDAVVLSHCSWYFESQTRLIDTLIKIRSWTPTLCFSEWNLKPTKLDQVPHLLAILIQGQVEAFKTASTANIRTPFDRTTLLEIVQQSGWTLQSESAIDSSYLDDGRWEVSTCLEGSLVEAEMGGMPSRLLDLLRSQIALLKDLSDGGRIRALDSFSIVATHA